MLGGARMSRHVVVLTDSGVIHLGNWVQIDTSCIVLGEEDRLILVCHLSVY